MRRTISLLAALLLTVPAACGGPDGLAGTWKVSFFERGKQIDFWLLKITKKNSSLAGTIQPAKNGPESTLHDLKQDGKKLTFTIRIQDRPLEFECAVANETNKTLRGSMEIGGQLMAVQLERTSLDTLALKDPEGEPPTFERVKAMLGKQPIDPRVFELIATYYQEAQDNKVSPQELRDWTKALLKAAGEHGQRWHREMTFRAAERLAQSKGYEAHAEEMAREALKLADESPKPATQLRVLDVLATALEKIGKKEELTKLLPRRERLEEEAHREYRKKALPFAPEKFAGRKNKSERVVLVELFTGAQCPPCVAADLGFDGLEQTYRPSEVVLLQYHLHIPGPDVLTNDGSEARQTYYGKKIAGTPTLLFNGKLPNEANFGGPRQAAGTSYKQIRQTINPLLEGEAGASVEAEATRKGDRVTISARASQFKKASPKVMLRVVLVEEWVRYLGSNGLPYHSRVVRAFPGGVKGVPVENGEGKQKVTVDLLELRKELNRSLDADKFFLGAVRPMRFQDLRVVAFVQDDATQEVLQAVEVPVRDVK